MRSASRKLLALVAVVVAPACSRAPTVRTDQAVEVRVTDYAGAPVEGASLVTGTRDVSTTAKDGVAKLSLTGRDGDLFEIGIKCPTGYTPPAEPLLVRFLSVDGGLASHLARCRKVRHRLVVLVRANGGPDLPILRLGRVVGTTDQSGAASLMLDLDLDERAELTLSTASLAKEKVTPRDPSAVFDLGDSDDVKVFDVTFSRPKPPPKRAAARRIGPVPM